MRTKAESTLASKKSRANNLIGAHNVRLIKYILYTRLKDLKKLNILISF